MSIINKPFALLLSWFNSWTGSYAVALLLFALLVKIVMLPLSIKQQKTQIKGAKLRPKMAAIEKKYAGRTDRKTLEKKQQELMALQQAEGYSPLSGCLPLLIQLPIIIILYNIIQKPLTHICGFDSATVEAIRTAVGAVAKDSEITLVSLINANGGAGLGQEILGPVSELNFNLFGLDLGATPSITNISWLVIIPILTCLSSFVSMKVSRKFTVNPALQANNSPETRTSNIIMDLMMPAMSLFLAFSLPAALGLYWIYQSLLGMLQQFILSRAMPLPTYTEEEIRAILKAEKERANANRVAMRTGETSSKSLHHIDDDDEEDAFVPEIRSKFDDEDEDEAPEKAVPAKPAAPAAQKNTHKRQMKKKK